MWHPSYIRMCFTLIRCYIWPLHDIPSLRINFVGSYTYTWCQAWCKGKEPFLSKDKQPPSFLFTIFFLIRKDKEPKHTCDAKNLYQNFCVNKDFHSYNISKCDNY